MQDPNERANGQATRVLGGNATLVAHGAYLEDDVERLAEKLLLALRVLEGRLVLAAQLRLVVRGELLLLLNPLVRLADVCQVVLAPISLFLHSERRGMAYGEQAFKMRLRCILNRGQRRECTGKTRRRGSQVHAVIG